MSRPNVRESSPSPASDPAPEVASKSAAAHAAERRRRWIPPVVAVLLLLLVLLTLRPPAGVGGANGNGDAEMANVGNGAGQGRQELAGTTAAAGEDLGGQSTIDAQAAPHLGLTDDPEPPADEATQATHMTSRSSADEPAGPSETTPAASLPALGFATDLTASPPPRSNPAEKTQTTSNPGTTAIGTAGGTPGLASFFGTTGHGTRFAYLIDKSGSMSGQPFEAAKAELIRSLRALQSHEHFFVAFYDGDAEFMPGQRMLPATPNNVERAVDWVRSVSLGGSTDPTEALTFSLSRLKPDTLWLLTDGAFSADVVQSITQHNPDRRTHINTLAFVKRDGEALLRIIADQNRGDYRFIPANP